MSAQDHVVDIDFRSWQARHDAATSDFISWYEELSRRIDSEGLTERLSGQITMLSSVLWYLLTPKEYKKLVKRSLK